jgi:hypothetical protein
MLTRLRLRAHLSLVLLAGVLATMSGCGSTSPTSSPTSPTAPTGISRERAVDIARQQVTFTPLSAKIEF